MADPHIAQSFPSVFSGYEFGGQQRALAATADWFERLSAETAARMGFTSYTPREAFAVRSRDLTLVAPETRASR